MLIEFAGLPNSGKSSNIGVVKDYFSRSGHRTKLVAEGARTVPFSNTYRVEFACWTANQSLNSVLEASLGTDREILILQDRGLFDALAFLKLLALQGHTTDEAIKDLMDYFATSRWTRLVDLVILFGVTPERAVERDLAAKLNALPGVITNIETMRSLSTAYEFVLEHYGDRFVRIERLDTTNTTQLEAAQRVIQMIQASMER